MKQRTITKEDLYRMTFTGSPEVSPDGKYAAYVVTEISEENNGYSSSLYMSDLSGEVQQLTTPYSQEKLIRDTMPKWSPDNASIAFLSNRNEKTQIWLLSTHGGEAKPITETEEDIDEFSWSPNGKRIVFTTKEKTNTEQENKDVTVITNLRYKANGEGFIDGYTHIWCLDLETLETEKLTAGPYNHHSPSFTSDSDHVIYLASKNEDREIINLENLYAYDLNEQKETVLYQGKGDISDPKVSPDGNYIAFAGHEEGETSGATPSVWIVPSAGGEARNLTVNFDYPVGNSVGVDANYDQSSRQIAWSEDSQSLLFLATLGGDCGILRTDLQGDVEKVAVYKGNVITSFAASNATLLFVKADPHNPGDLYFHGENGPEQLSRHNEGLLSELTLSTPEGFTYHGAENWNIEGWILPPPDRDLNQKAPVVLEIHGGPHSTYGNAFHHEFQWLAAKGYAVVYTNPRGSQGYGDTFVKGSIGDWGNRDRIDIMAGLDYVLEHYDYCDPERLYVTGGSYGGYMTNYVITKTDRFRAAVTQRSISNLYSMIGTSDIGFYFNSIELGGADLWKYESKVQHASPIKEAPDVNTPTCIIHSEEDLRCPMEQGEQWYMALTRLGVDTRFVRFKGENHELSRSGKPKNRVRRLQEIGDWFDWYEKT